MTRGPKARGSVTIKDVAREAGVSIATVSRSLNLPAIVQPETRERVRAVASRLGYVPHGAALSLIKRRTNTVAVVLPDISGDFFSELICAIDAAARRAHYHVLVSSAHSDAAEVEALLRTLNGRVDGLIAMAPDRASLDRIVHHPMRVPVLLLRGPFDGWQGAALRVDNYGGARAMMSHLLGLGHRRIAFLSGPEGNHDNAERRRAYHDALVAAGEDRREHVLVGDFTEEAGYRAAGELLEIEPLPSALFCANDAMAIGALAGLQQRGVRVPQQIALTGFDDVRLACFTTPPLTTVRVPIGQLGERALLWVLGELQQDGAEPLRDTLPTELIVRASCGALSR